MGEAMQLQWLDNITYQFTIASPTATDLPAGRKHVTKATQLNPAEFDIVLIAIKPQLISDILPAYAFPLKLQGCFVSIGASCSICKIAGVVGKQTIERVMPNLAGMVGRGVSKRCELQMHRSKTKEPSGGDRHVQPDQTLRTFSSTTIGGSCHWARVGD